MALNFYIYQLICQVFFRFLTNFYIFFRMSHLIFFSLADHLLFHQHLLGGPDQRLFIGCLLPSRQFQEFIAPIVFTLSGTCSSICAARVPALLEYLNTWVS